VRLAHEPQRSRQGVKVLAPFRWSGDGAQGKPLKGAVSPMPEPITNPNNVLDQATQDRPADIPCPFVYASGKQCTGHIVRIEAYKADLRWTQLDDGTWTFSTGQPRSHYHLFCSAKDNHAGWGKEDRLKFYYDQLPDSLRKIINISS
jgi:hypothetical protein